MRLVFNERKAAQAAAHLVERHGGRMNYTIMLKLLYLADRASLVKHGTTITGDNMFCMSKGPVLSRVLDLIHAGQLDTQDRDWFDVISPASGREVALAVPNPSVDELSEEEVSILDAIDSKFGGLTLGQIIELVHTLPEWKDPEGSSIRIDPAEILRFEGWSREMIETATQEAEEDRFFSNLG